MSYIVAALHHYCLDPMEKLIVAWKPWQILYILYISKSKAGKMIFENYCYFTEHFLTQLRN